MRLFDLLVGFFGDLGWVVVPCLFDDDGSWFRVGCGGVLVDVVIINGVVHLGVIGGSYFRGEVYDLGFFEDLRGFLSGCCSVGGVVRCRLIC